jgi:hypothetical protein
MGHWWEWVASDADIKIYTPYAVEQWEPAMDAALLRDIGDFFYLRKGLSLAGYEKHGADEKHGAKEENMRRVVRALWEHPNWDKK